MKTSTKIISVIILSVGLIGGAFAYGKYKYGGHAGHAAYVVSHISKKLELDDSQSQALAALKDQILISKQKMHEQTKPVREEITELLDADTFDQSAALEMITTKTAVINESAPEVIAALGTFLDSLNADQKAEVLEFIERKKKYRHDHH